MKRPLKVSTTNLEEGGLAALADGVDPELVEASGRGDGGVVVGAGRFTFGVAAVDGPVVVAVVEDVAVAVVGQAVLADLLRQGAILALKMIVKYAPFADDCQNAYVIVAIS